MIDIILDALLDTAKLIPFLFFTYLAMEYLEHKAGDRAQGMMRKAGKFGPVIGGALGIIPQCGFSAAASGLYAGRVITLGTLMAVYLSTSDEMLPILISEQAPVQTIIRILLIKAVAGILVGFAMDLLIRREDDKHDHIHEICEHEHCHCERGIFSSALTHTIQIGLFILLMNLILGGVIEFGGEEILTDLLLNHPIAGPVLSGLVGMIPNCAGSVIITQLYLQGAMGFGSAMAGLLNGTGVGILVLFRVNHDKKENCKILGMLYLIGTLIGIVLEYASMGVVK